MKTSIVFSTTQGPISRAIRFLTRSPVSHCGIGIRVFGLDAVLHADLFGVVLTPRARYARENKVLAEHLAPELSEERLQKAIALLDLPYDYAGLFGHLPVLIGRWFQRKIRNPFRDPNRLVCSELVVRVFAESDERLQSLDPEEATPEDVLEAVAERYPSVVTSAP